VFFITLCDIQLSAIRLKCSFLALFTLLLSNGQFRIPFLTKGQDEKNTFVLTDLIYDDSNFNQLRI